MTDDDQNAPQCEDCCESPCICDPRWKWLTDTVRAEKGVVQFCMTEDGHIGVWVAPIGDDTPALGCGDTAEEAIDSARAAAPLTPPEGR